MPHTSTNLHTQTSHVTHLYFGNTTSKEVTSHTPHTQQSHITYLLPPNTTHKNEQCQISQTDKRVISRTPTHTNESCNIPLPGQLHTQTSHGTYRTNIKKSYTQQGHITHTTKSYHTQQRDITYLYPPNTTHKNEQCRISHTDKQVMSRTPTHTNESRHIPLPGQLHTQTSHGTYCTNIKKSYYISLPP